MRKLKVIQRPKCKGWYVRTKIQGRDKWTYLSDNKAEAEKLAKDYKRQLMMRKVEGYNSQADITLCVGRYIKDKFGTTLTTDKSRRKYKTIIERFRDFVLDHGAQNVSEVNMRLIMDYLNMRSESISGKSWDFERMVLSNFFKYCHKNDWVLENPVSNIPTKKIPVPHVEHFDSEEVTELLEYMRKKDFKVPYYELIKTILYTGMRLNETIHLTKKDVDLKRGLIIVQEKVINGKLWQPKTKEKRYVPISDEIRELILKQMKTPGELLFQNTRNKPLLDRRVLERFQDSCKEAGLKKVHVHSLRHTFCSIATEKGIPAEVIQAILGHKSDSMTRRYRHLKPDFLGDMMRGFKY